ncbi:low molecular weight protein-tyrosine-phosphatase [Curtobacterium pusillum]|nr:low molecular weight protein-tyrosine-phosphatase [Curtobacterium pusillum]
MTQADDATRTVPPGLHADATAVAVSRSLRHDVPMTTDDGAPFRVSFVCSGNICRSPMAGIVFAQLAAEAGMAERFHVESAGTGDWHVGEPADERTIAALAARGYDGSRHRARQFDPDRFPDLDLVVALDRSHERILRSWAPTMDDAAKVTLLLRYDDAWPQQTDVPDPYYADRHEFDRVLSTVERACRALFRQLEPAVRQGAP